MTQTAEELQRALNGHAAHGPRSGRISKRVEAIPPSGIRRFFDLLATLDNVVSLGVGEPDFTTPWHIREAAIYSIERGYTMYTSNHGMLELRQAVSDHIFRLYGVRYRPEDEIFITVGVSEGLDLALRAVLNPGDEVLIPDPGYVSYGPGVTLALGEPIPVLTSVENDFAPTAAEIESKITPRTKALLLGYPNNPTGAVVDRETMAEIAEVAVRNDLIVISDEIYDRLVYGGHQHTCVPSLPGMQERTILLGGFSKAYAMTGWRIAFACGPADLIAGMVKIHQYSMLCAPITAQYAALEALKSGEQAVHEMVAEYDQRRRVIVAGFNRIGLDCFEPRGAFYAFPSIKITGMTSEAFAEGLLVEEHVAVVPGTAFGQSGEGYVRCCYATSLPQIEDALMRIERFVLKHRID